MTVEPNSVPGTEVETWDDSNVGMEDVGAGDIIIPRLQIVHAQGKLRDNLTKLEFPSLKVVILGLVKQRIMWASEIDDGDKPLCKSPDHEHGFPNMRDNVPVDKRFPWEKSNFNLADFPAGGPNSLNNLVTLPCESCVFNQWSTSDAGKNVPPPCSEQHTYPLLYTPDDGETWTAALFTVQKTGISPSKQYISGFAAAKQPMFTSYTELSLKLLQRGNVNYSVPVFKKLEQTDRKSWSEYADRVRSIRAFIRQAPRRQDESTEEEPVVMTNNENTAPVSTPAPAQAAPASTPAPAQTATPTAVKEDDLPF